MGHTKKIQIMWNIKTLPYEIQTKILINLTTTDINLLKTTIPQWQHACENLIVLKHMLNENYKNSQILDTHDLKNIKTLSTNPKYLKEILKQLEVTNVNFKNIVNTWKEINYNSNETL